MISTSTMITTPTMCQAAEIEFSTASSRTPLRLSRKCISTITEKTMKIVPVEVLSPNQRLSSAVQKVAAP